MEQQKVKKKTFLLTFNQLKICVFGSTDVFKNSPFLISIIFFQRMALLLNFLKAKKLWILLRLTKYLSTVFADTLPWPKHQMMKPFLNFSLKGQEMEVPVLFAKSLSLLRLDNRHFQVEELTAKEESSRYLFFQCWLSMLDGMGKFIL